MESEQKKYQFSGEKKYPKKIAFFGKDIETIGIYLESKLC